MKVIITIIISLSSLFSFVVLGQVNSKHVSVSDYYKSDGTFIPSHYRTSPNNTNRDNFSTRGNVNPYTGSVGNIEPDSKRNNNINNDLQKIIDNGRQLIPSVNQLQYNDDVFLKQQMSDVLAEFEKRNQMIDKALVHIDKPFYTVKSQANMRVSGNKNAEIIYVLSPSRDGVFVLNFSGDWWKVFFKGQEGYIHRTLLTKSKLTY